MSVREVERRAAAELAHPGAAPRTPRVDCDVLRLEEEWSQRLGTAVKIRSSRGKRSGKLILTYRTLEQLDILLNKLGRA